MKDSTFMVVCSMLSGFITGYFQQPVLMVVSISVFSFLAYLSAKKESAE
jgi:hypothetical protein